LQYPDSLNRNPMTGLSSAHLAAKAVMDKMNKKLSGVFVALFLALVLIHPADGGGWQVHTSIHTTVNIYQR